MKSNTKEAHKKAGILTLLTLGGFALLSAIVWLIIMTLGPVGIALIGIIVMVGFIYFAFYSIARQEQRFK